MEPLYILFVTKVKTKLSAPGKNQEKHEKNEKKKEQFIQKFRILNSYGHCKMYLNLAVQNSKKSNKYSPSNQMNV